MNVNKLYGAILGDLAGQPYEYPPNKYKKAFRVHNPDSHITDDTILTLAGAYSILSGTPIEFAYRTFAKKYIHQGFGGGFLEWLKTKKGTIGNSFGNGCLMRLSPFIYKGDTLTALQSVMTSHAHDESVRSSIKLLELYQGRYSDVVAKPNKFYSFSSKAIHSIKFCEEVFLYTKSTHEAIELAVKLGGDTDTHASIVGELGNYTYDDLTEQDIEYVESKLDKFLLEILKTFNNG